MRNETSIKIWQAVVSKLVEQLTTDSKFDSSNLSATCSRRQMVKEKVFRIRPTSDFTMEQHALKM